jgi:hypothetical protein
METTSDYETWLIETGDRVIQKKAQEGLAGLGAWELLVYCLWVADYGMRNAGDLDTAVNLHSPFKSDGLRAADALLLPLAREMFALDLTQLDREYFLRFEPVCDELRLAEPPGHNIAQSP